MPLINKACLKELFQDPPSCLDIVIVKRDIWVVHVSHIGHALTHLTPESCVFEYRFTALLIEFFDAVFLDILLS